MIACRLYWYVERDLLVAMFVDACSLKLRQKSICCRQKYSVVEGG
jgi:hypothetical protein